MKKPGWILLTTTLIILFSSCNPEEKSWNIAKLKNTLDAYEAFSLKFPQSIYLDSAKILSNNLLPAFPVIINSEIISAESHNCKIKFKLSVRHRIGQLDTIQNLTVMVDLKFANAIILGSAEILSKEKIKPYLSLLDCEYYNNYNNCYGDAKMKLSVSNKFDFDKEAETEVLIEFKE
jgi:hypothetical protein